MGRFVRPLLRLVACMECERGAVVYRVVFWIVVVEWMSGRVS